MRIGVVSVVQAKQSSIELSPGHFEAGDPSGIIFQGQGDEFVKNGNIFHQVPVDWFIDRCIGLGDRVPFFFLLNTDFYFTNRSEIFIQFITVPSIETFSKITGIFQ